MLVQGGSQFLLKKQLMKLVGANFRIYEGSDETRMVYFIHQKGFKLKEDIRVFADEGQTQEVFRLATRKIMDFNASFQVIDSATGTVLGTLNRKGLASMLRDEWMVMDAHGTQIGKVWEDSILMALLRRFLSNLVPQNYDGFLGEQKVADYRQLFGLVGYKLDFSIAPGLAVDPRLYIGAAILLAAVEGRESG